MGTQYYPWQITMGAVRKRVSCYFEGRTVILGAGLSSLRFVALADELKFNLRDVIGSVHHV
jgi:hypothetical protein